MAFITTIKDKIYYKNPKIYRVDPLSGEYFKYRWKGLVMQSFESESCK